VFAGALAASRYGTLTEYYAVATTTFANTFLTTDNSLYTPTLLLQGNHREGRAAPTRPDRRTTFGLQRWSPWSQRSRFSSCQRRQGVDPLPHQRRRWRGVSSRQDFRQGTEPSRQPQQCKAQFPAGGRKVEKPPPGDFHDRPALCSFSKAWRCCPVDSPVLSLVSVENQDCSC
jgi:hypothetical protein